MCTSRTRMDIVLHIEKDEEREAGTRDRNETNVYFQNKYLRERGIKRAKMCFLFDLQLYFSFRSNGLLLFLPRPYCHHSGNYPTTHLLSTSSPLFRASSRGFSAPAPVGG